MKNAGRRSLLALASAILLILFILSNVLFFFDRSPERIFDRMNRNNRMWRMPHGGLLLALASAILLILSIVSSFFILLQSNTGEDI